MKFAFLIMGGFHSAEDSAAIHGGQAQIIGVDDLQEACAVMEATGCKIPIGYVTHLPEMDDVYKAAFSR